MSNANATVEAAPLSVDMRVIVQKGCVARGVVKGVTAKVTKIEPMGAEFGHSAKVALCLMNGFNAGKTVVFFVRHVNRLGDVFVSMNDGDPTHRIEVRRAAPRSLT